MKFLSSKRRIVIAVIILIALFLIRPGASHLKSRIILSISAGVGRPVDIGSVHLRLLPRPGFDLANLVVYDDPGFSAEPILRAGEVTADLRLMSLIRGHLEISRLDLSEPSLNLALREGGRWNLESLVARAAHTPSAPTAKGKSEPRTGFPYIEGSSGRINFKVGPEKKPYALTNADFSLWQESENSWGVRLKAQPFRSDINLNDTGQLQIDGTWQRASVLRETPLQFSLEWTRAQLGQVTKFASGNDWGWRGAVQLNVSLSGTPEKLRVVSDVSLDDFRRYDITSAHPVRMATHCEAEYGSATREFHQVSCQAPVGDGRITLTGDVGLPSIHHYDVVLSAEDVPAGAAVSLLQRMKKNLPEDLAAQGTVHAKLAVRNDASSGAKPQFLGQGEITGFRLTSLANKSEIGPETIPFSFRDSVAGMRGQKFPVVAGQTHAAQGSRLEIGPIMLAARGGGPTARGEINQLGYNFSIAGEADVARVLRLARTFGLPALSTSADGSTHLDLQVAGSWAGANAAIAGPQVTGTAKLKNVRVAIRDVGGPVEIVSAEIQLTPDKTKLQKLVSKAGGGVWSGSMEMPRGCGAPAACPMHYILSAEELALGQLSDWANPNRKKAWYQVLDTQRPPSVLERLQATAALKVGRLRLGKVEATHVSATINLDKGKLEISQLNADFLGGTHRGMWRADFSAKPPLCVGQGALTGISFTQLENSVNDAWITGTASGTYELKGTCPGKFWESASGTVAIDMKDGVLPHVLLGDDIEPLHVKRLRATAQLEAGKLKIGDAILDSPGGRYELTGTASLNRDIDLKLTRAGNGVAFPAYAITGTVSEPKVVAIPHTEQAQLKTALHATSDK